jgi:hypothetical protein
MGRYLLIVNPFRMEERTDLAQPTTRTPVRAVLSYGLVSFSRLTVFAIDDNVGRVAP